MDLLWFTIKNDWPVLAPIIACSIALAAVGFNRLKFYSDNERDVVQFVQRFQRELQQGQLERGQFACQQLGGLVGEVAEDGLQILSTNREGFERSFDITLALAVRRLEQFLPVLGTIGTIAPYLGLFGTVVRILITFGEMSTAGGNAAGAPAIMFGIGSALIATAFGLIVAILSVTLNNYFRATVSRFESDFQMLKLVFLSVAENASIPVVNPAAAMAAPGMPVAAGRPANMPQPGYGSSMY